VCTTASKLIILGRIYAFKFSGIEKGGSSEPSEPPLPTPLEGFINQQQSTISLAAVVAVNRILNVSVPEPFFPTSFLTPRKRKKSGLATRDYIGDA